MHGGGGGEQEGGREIEDLAQVKNRHRPGTVSLGQLADHPGTLGPDGDDGVGRAGAVGLEAEERHAASLGLGEHNLQTEHVMPTEEQG